MIKIFNCRIVISALVMILFILQSNYPQVSGVVRDQLTLLPVAGAMVTLQTTNIKTITAADGSFVLTNAIGADLVIVSAKKYYYNSSVTVVHQLQTLKY